nr:hypothetical protein [Bacteroidia bacterium]
MKGILHFICIKSNLKKRLTILLGLAFNIIAFTPVSAINRTSAASGNFTNAASWMPAGIPSPGDVITITNNHILTVDNNISVASITINTGGKLIWAAGKKLTISNGITINGTADLIEGDIDLTQSASFKIGAAGTLTWQPSNNSITGATLFTNGVEDFHPTSTLIINKWYNYTNVPLGSVVTGNFGNLAVTTLSNGLLFEWNQNNQFQQHKILGKFTIDQGWIVLDKSGSISNTTIGEIYLKNVNSYLDLHSGDHAGTFKVTTNNLTNIGGTMNGIYNGNGNINFEVNGDVLNLGNIELIYNSGVQNTSNGNASIKVTGLYKQTHGDFRGIFNISSTSTGKVNMEFGSMELTGGIFMAQYACHTNNDLSTFLVHNDLILDYTNASSKFRCNGLNSLSGIQSNLKLQLTVEGNLYVKGNASAEFTSSASIGTENVEIKGETTFEGCNSNFNYGTHLTNIVFHENVSVKGGVTNLSKTDGSLNVTLNKNLTIQSGQLNIKSDKGNATLNLLGNYSQSGGLMYFHFNDATATNNAVYLYVDGDFSILNGSLTFDNNSTSTASHILAIAGNKFTTGGQAIITSALSIANSVFSTIYF